MSDETDIETGEDEAAGWLAIDAALDPLYGDQEPSHYGTIIKYSLGGPDPIDGISVYKSEKNGPHWHYVSYGFSELYEKESENTEYSGYGFELTMRLVRSPGEDEPPSWPMSVMQNLARYVFGTGSIFDKGHYLDCNGEIALDTGTQLRALIFTEDPELRTIDTPHGKVIFLQMVGVTLDELQAAKNWDTLSLAGLLAEQNPFLIVDLHRKSIMSDPAIVEKVEQGIAKDGSNTGSLFLAQLQYKTNLLGKCNLTIGAGATGDFLALLPARLNHGREFVLIGTDMAIQFKTADKFSSEQKKDGIVLSLTAQDIAKIGTDVKQRAGEYKINDKFVITVIKTEVKNHDGKVIEVIG